MRRRVVITGIGLLSPLGLDATSTWKGLLAGKSGIGLITKFDATGFASRIAGEVKGFHPEDVVGAKEARRMDTFISYALAAADEAVADARLTIGGALADRVGVFVGSGIGGLSFLEAQYRQYTAKGPRRISPFFIPGMIINLAAGQISMRFGARGPNLAVATACATGTHAVGESMRLIRSGHADAMITGGTEGVITPLAVGGFCAMKALSTRNEDPERASRPFDVDRDGFVIGEGAGILILEEREEARRRGASIYAEVCGYGMSGDAYHVSAPPEDGAGAIRAMRLALEDAGVGPEAVDYINAHGTGTPAGDRIEALAIKNVLGEHASRVAVSSTKSMTGHLLGAAGALEAAVAALAIRDGVIPPTTNLDHPDPECDLDLVPNRSREMQVGVVMSNSFGFGGTNAALLLKKHVDDEGPVSDAPQREKPA